MPLSITRKEAEEIVVNGPCRIRVQQIRANRVTLSIAADREVTILRAEVTPRPRPQNPGE